MMPHDDLHDGALEARLRRHYQSSYEPPPNPMQVWEQVAQRLDIQNYQATLDAIERNYREDGRMIDLEGRTGAPANTATLGSGPKRTRRHLRALAAIAATFLIIATSGTVFGLLAAHHRLPVGTAKPTSTESPSTLLPPHFDVGQMQMFSDRDGWVAGTLNVYTPTLATGVLLHFDGFRWNIAYKLPHSLFYTISMISPTEGWVTGITVAGNARGSTTGSFILHYHRGQWVQEPAPMEAMFSLKMFSATSGWALGARITNGKPDNKRQVAVYQNGAWAVSNEPCWVCQVTFSSDEEGWAWGVPNNVTTINSKSAYGFWHYQHGEWMPVSFPGLDASLTSDMEFSNSANGWAVQWFNSSNFSTILLHYDGVAWQPWTVPTDVLTFYGAGWQIYPVAPTEFFIVSAVSNANSTVQSLVLLHYANYAWSTLVLPENYLSASGIPRDTEITGISVIAPNDLWVASTPVVGGDLHGNVIGHYHNGQWTLYQ